MTETLKNAIRRWLRHEAAGREQAAEQSLSGVFSRLPMPMPSAAFVSRVLAEAGWAPRAPLFHDLTSQRLRALVTAAGALVVVALLFVPSVLSAVWLVASSLDPLQLGADLLASGVARVAESVAVWEALAGVAGAVGGALSSPRLLAILVAAALISLTAFGVLQSLLLSNRSAYHVES